MFYRDLAQLVAYLVWDQGAAGSSPAIPTKIAAKSRSEKNGFLRLSGLYNEIKKINRIYHLSADAVVES